MIGTPYWMAPEVIQEISYDSKADVWSLGISILEMCEGHPPHFNVHPMRAIFMIPMKPAPRFAEPDRWSPDMNDFLCSCLVKSADERVSSSTLLRHPWIANEVSSAREDVGIPCLRQLVEDNWDGIQSSRIGRRLSFQRGSLDLVGRLGNEALRNRVKAQLNERKLNKQESSVTTLEPDVLPREDTGTLIRSELPSMSASPSALSLCEDESPFSSPDRDGLPSATNPFQGSLKINDFPRIEKISRSTSSQSVYQTGTMDGSGMMGNTLKSFLRKNPFGGSLEEPIGYTNRKVNIDVDPTGIYSFKQLLGEGSYGLVYRGDNLRNREEVAIKVLPCPSDKDIGMEVEFLRKLECPYIVTFQQAFVYARELWIVMEFCSGGSISDIIRYTKRPLDEFQLVGVVASCLLALNYLHSMFGIHRDVKAGNILLTEDGKAKLADFGISAQLSPSREFRNTLIGTPFWMAPEVIMEDEYDYKADIWSLGITILEMGEGRPPYFDLHPMRAVFLIPMKPAPSLQEPEKWSPDMADFLSNCLVKDAAIRSDAGSLLKHDWIQHVSSLIQKGLGLAKLRELVHDNMETLEHYRTQRSLLQNKLRPLTNTKILRSSMPNRSKSEVIQDAKPVKANSLFVIDEGLKSKDGSEGSDDAPWSIKASHYEWMKTLNYETRASGVRNAEMIQALQVERPKNKIPFQPQIKSLLDVMFKGRRNEPNKRSGNALSFASKLPQGMKPRNAILNEILGKINSPIDGGQSFEVFHEQFLIFIQMTGRLELYSRSRLFCGDDETLSCIR